jgi:DNA-binding MarR family transcriptional regulator
VIARQRFLVHPTTAGRAAKIAAVRILDEQQRRFLVPLSEQERRYLGEILNRVYAAQAAAGGRA